MQSWAEAFEATLFGAHEREVIQNFEVETECEDVRDAMDSGADGSPSFVGEAFHGVDSTVDLVAGDMDSLQVSVLNSGLAESVLDVSSDAALEPSCVEEMSGVVAVGIYYSVFGST